MASQSHQPNPSAATRSRRRASRGGGVPAALINDRGAALIVVLLAIVVLLPPTIVLTTLAIRWQRQSLDYRDTIDEEFTAQAGFEEARNRVAAVGAGLAPNEGSSFQMRDLGNRTVSAHIAREEDVVLTLDGRILEGKAAEQADLRLAGTDPEGRVVYRFRKLEIYVIQVDVSRRPTLPGVRLYGVIAKLPDGSLQTLGTTINRGYFD